MSTPEEYAKDLINRFNGLGFGMVICKLFSKTQIREMQILSLLHFKPENEEAIKYNQFLKDTEKIIDTL
jgi:hypothetical protein